MTDNGQLVDDFGVDGLFGQEDETSAGGGLQLTDDFSLDEFPQGGGGDLFEGLPAFAPEEEGGIDEDPFRLLDMGGGGGSLPSQVPVEDPFTDLEDLGEGDYDPPTDLTLPNQEEGGDDFDSDFIDFGDGEVGDTDMFSPDAQSTSREDGGTPENPIDPRDAQSAENFSDILSRDGMEIVRSGERKLQPTDLDLGHRILSAEEARDIAERMPEKKGVSEALKTAWDQLSPSGANTGAKAVAEVSGGILLAKAAAPLAVGLGVETAGLGFLAVEGLAYIVGSFGGKWIAELLSDEDEKVEELLAAKTRLHSNSYGDNVGLQDRDLRIVTEAYNKNLIVKSRLSEGDWMSSVADFTAKNAEFVADIASISKSMGAVSKLLLNPKNAKRVQRLAGSLVEAGRYKTVGAAINDLYKPIFLKTVAKDPKAAEALSRMVGAGETAAMSSAEFLEELTKFLASPKQKAGSRAFNALSTMVLSGAVHSTPFDSGMKQRMASLDGESSYGKAAAQNMIEYLSEGLGAAYFDPFLGKLFKGISSKMTGKTFEKALSRVGIDSAEEAMKRVSPFLKRAKIAATTLSERTGTESAISEYWEESAGDLINSVLDLNDDGETPQSLRIGSALLSLVPHNSEQWELFRNLAIMPASASIAGGMLGGNTESQSERIKNQRSAIRKFYDMDPDAPIITSKEEVDKHVRELYDIVREGDMEKNSRRFMFIPKIFKNLPKVMKYYKGSEARTWSNILQSESLVELQDRLEELEATKGNSLDETGRSEEGLKFFEDLVLRLNDHAVNAQYGNIVKGGYSLKNRINITADDDTAKLLETMLSEGHVEDVPSFIDAKTGGGTGGGGLHTTENYDLDAIAASDAIPKKFQGDAGAVERAIMPHVVFEENSSGVVRDKEGEVVYEGEGEKKKKKRKPVISHIAGNTNWESEIIDPKEGGDQSKAAKVIGKAVQAHLTSNKSQDLIEGGGRTADAKEAADLIRLTVQNLQRQAADKKSAYPIQVKLIPSFIAKNIPGYEKKKGMSYAPVVLSQVKKIDGKPVHVVYITPRATAADIKEDLVEGAYRMSGISPNSPSSFKEKGVAAVASKMSDMVRTLERSVDSLHSKPVGEKKATRVTAALSFLKKFQELSLALKDAEGDDGKVSVGVGKNQRILSVEEVSAQMFEMLSKLTASYLESSDTKATGNRVWRGRAEVNAQAEALAKELRENTQLAPLANVFGSWIKKNINDFLPSRDQELLSMFLSESEASVKNPLKEEKKETKPKGEKKETKPKEEKKETKPKEEKKETPKEVVDDIIDVLNNMDLDDDILNSASAEYVVADGAALVETYANLFARELVKKWMEDPSKLQGGDPLVKLDQWLEAVAGAAVNNEEVQKKFLEKLKKFQKKYQLPVLRDEGRDAFLETLSSTLSSVITDGQFNEGWDYAAYSAEISAGKWVERQQKAFPSPKGMGSWRKEGKWVTPEEDSKEGAKPTFEGDFSIHAFEYDPTDFIHRWARRLGNTTLAEVGQYIKATESGSVDPGDASQWAYPAYLVQEVAKSLPALFESHFGITGINLDTAVEAFGSVFNVSKEVILGEMDTELPNAIASSYARYASRNQALNADQKNKGKEEAEADESQTLLDHYTDLLNSPNAEASMFFDAGRKAEYFTQELFARIGLASGTAKTLLVEAIETDAARAAVADVSGETYRRYLTTQGDSAAERALISKFNQADVTYDEYASLFSLMSKVRVISPVESRFNRNGVATGFNPADVSSKVTWVDTVQENLNLFMRSDAMANQTGRDFANIYRNAVYNAYRAEGFVSTSGVEGTPRRAAYELAELADKKFNLSEVPKELYPIYDFMARFFNLDSETLRSVDSKVLEVEHSRRKTFERRVAREVKKGLTRNDAVNKVLTTSPELAEPSEEVIVPIARMFFLNLSHAWAFHPSEKRKDKKYDENNQWKMFQYHSTAGLSRNSVKGGGSVTSTENLASNMLQSARRELGIGGGNLMQREADTATLWEVFASALGSDKGIADAARRRDGSRQPVLFLSSHFGDISEREGWNVFMETNHVLTTSGALGDVKKGAGIIAATNPDEFSRADIGISLLEKIRNPDSEGNVLVWMGVLGDRTHLYYRKAKLRSVEESVKLHRELMERAIAAAEKTGARIPSRKASWAEHFAIFAPPVSSSDSSAIANYRVFLLENAMALFGDHFMTKFKDGEAFNKRSSNLLSTGIPANELIWESIMGRKKVNFVVINDPELVSSALQSLFPGMSRDAILAEEGDGFGVGFSEAMEAANKAFGIYNTGSQEEGVGQLDAMKSIIMNEDVLLKQSIGRLSKELAESDSGGLKLLYQLKEAHEKAGGEKVDFIFFASGAKYSDTPSETVFETYEDDAKFDLAPSVKKALDNGTFKFETVQSFNPGDMRFQLKLQKPAETHAGIFPKQILAAFSNFPEVRDVLIQAQSAQQEAFISAISLEVEERMEKDKITEEEALEKVVSGMASSQYTPLTDVFEEKLLESFGPITRKAAERNIASDISKNLLHKGEVIQEIEWPLLSVDDSLDDFRVVDTEDGPKLRIARIMANIQGKRYSEGAKNQRPLEEVEAQLRASYTSYLDMFEDPEEVIRTKGKGGTILYHELDEVEVKGVVGYTIPGEPVLIARIPIDNTYNTAFVRLQAPVEVGGSYPPNLVRTTLSVRIMAGADFDGDKRFVISLARTESGTIDHEDSNFPLFTAMAKTYADTDNIPLLLNPLDISPVEDRVPEVQAKLTSAFDRLTEKKGKEGLSNYEEMLLTSLSDIVGSDDKVLDVVGALNMRENNQIGKRGLPITAANIYGLNLLASFDYGMSDIEEKSKGGKVKYTPPMYDVTFDNPLSPGESLKLKVAVRSNREHDNYEHTTKKIFGTMLTLFVDHANLRLLDKMGIDDTNISTVMGLMYMHGGFKDLDEAVDYLFGVVVPFMYSQPILADAAASKNSSSISVRKGRSIWATKEAELDSFKKKGVYVGRTPKDKIRENNTTGNITPGGEALFLQLTQNLRHLSSAVAGLRTSFMRGVATVSGEEKLWNSLASLTPDRMDSAGFDGDGALTDLVGKTLRNFEILNKVAFNAGSRNSATWMSTFSSLFAANKTLVNAKGVVGDGNPASEREMLVNAIVRPALLPTSPVTHDATYDAFHHAMAGLLSLRGLFNLSDKDVSGYLFKKAGSFEEFFSTYSVDQGITRNETLAGNEKHSILSRLGNVLVILTNRYVKEHGANNSFLNSITLREYDRSKNPRDFKSSAAYVIGLKVNPMASLGYEAVTKWNDDMQKLGRRMNGFKEAVTIARNSGDQAEIDKATREFLENNRAYNRLIATAPDAVSREAAISYATSFIRKKRAEGRNSVGELESGAMDGNVYDEGYNVSEAEMANRDSAEARKPKDGQIYSANSAGSLYHSIVSVSPNKSNVEQVVYSVELSQAERGSEFKDNSRDRAHEGFDELPEDLQKMFLAYALLRFGIDDSTARGSYLLLTSPKARARFDQETRAEETLYNEGVSKAASIPDRLSPAQLHQVEMMKAVTLFSYIKGGIGTSAVSTPGFDMKNEGGEDLMDDPSYNNFGEQKAKTKYDTERENVAYAKNMPFAIEALLAASQSLSTLITPLALRPKSSSAKSEHYSASAEILCPALMNEALEELKGVTTPRSFVEALSWAVFDSTDGDTSRIKKIHTTLQRLKKGLRAAAELPTKEARLRAARRLVAPYAIKYPTLNEYLNRMEEGASDNLVTKEKFFVAPMTYSEAVSSVRIHGERALDSKDGRAPWQLPLDHRSFEEVLRADFGDAFGSVARLFRGKAQVGTPDHDLELSFSADYVLATEKILDIAKTHQENKSAHDILRRSLNYERAIIERAKIDNRRINKALATGKDGKKIKNADMIKLARIMVSVLQDSELTFRGVKNHTLEDFGGSTYQAMKTFLLNTNLQTSWAVSTESYLDAVAEGKGADFEVWAVNQLLLSANEEVIDDIRDKYVKSVVDRMIASGAIKTPEQVKRATQTVKNGAYRSAEFTNTIFEELENAGILATSIVEAKAISESSYLSLAKLVNEMVNYTAIRPTGAKILREFIDEDGNVQNNWVSTNKYLPLRTISQGTAARNKRRGESGKDPMKVRQFEQRAGSSKSRHRTGYMSEFMLVDPDTDRDKDKVGYPQSLDSAEIRASWASTTSKSFANEAILVSLAHQRDGYGAPSLVLHQRAFESKNEISYVDSHISEGEWSRAINDLFSLADRYMKLRGAELTWSREAGVSGSEAMRSLIDNLSDDNVAGTNIMESLGYVKMETNGKRGLRPNQTLWVQKGAPAALAKHLVVQTFEDLKGSSKAAWIASLLVKINRNIKMIEVSFSAFHAFALSESWFAVLFTPWTIGRRIKNFKADYEALMLDPERVVPWVTSGLMLGAAPIEVLDVDEDSVFSQIADFMRSSKFFSKGAIVPQALETIRLKAETLLWGVLLPTMKLQLAEELYKSARKMKGFSEDKVSEDDLRADIAKHVNDALGGQNWADYLWANPKVQQALNLFMFSPDWTISALNIAGIAETATSTLPGEVNWLGYKAKTDFAKTQRLKYAAGFALWVHVVFPTIVQSVIAGAFSSKGGGDPEEGKTPLLSMLNEGGEKGNIDITPLLQSIARDRGVPGPRVRYYLRPGKQMRENLGWLEDPLREAFGKASPIVRAALASTGLNRISWAQDGDWYEHDVKKRGVNVLKNLVPFALIASSKLQYPSATHSLLAATLPEGKGFSKYKAEQEIAKTLIRYAGSPDVSANAAGALQEVIDSHIMGVKEKLDQSTVSGTFPEKEWEATIKRAFSTARTKINSDLRDEIAKGESADEAALTRLLTSAASLYETRKKAWKSLEAGVSRSIASRDSRSDPKRTEELLGWQKGIGKKSVYRAANRRKRGSARYYGKGKAFREYKEGRK